MITQLDTFFEDTDTTLRDHPPAAI